MRKTPRKNIGKRIMVLLMKGPKTGRQLAKLYASAGSVLSTYKRDGMVVLDKSTKPAVWRLTPRGVIQSSKWDYELKLKNEHPEQEPKVTKVDDTDIPDGLEPFHRDGLKIVSQLMERDPEAGSHEGKILSSLAGLIDFYESSKYPIKPEPDQVIETDLATTPIDWQVRHIEFLEEIVRNLTKKGE